MALCGWLGLDYVIARLFVYYFSHVQRPFPEAERALLAGLRGVQELAEVAFSKGEELRARLQVGAHIAKSVVLTVGAERRLSGETIVPIKWEAAGAPALFPRMEADLVLMPLEPGVSHLALRGVYQPPAGLVGEMLDRMALHRVAEAAVKLFVDRLAASLEPVGVQSTAPSGK